MGYFDCSVKFVISVIRMLVGWGKGARVGGGPVEVEVGGCEGLWWCCGDERRGRGVDV